MGPAPASGNIQTGQLCMCIGSFAHPNISTCSSAQARPKLMWVVWCDTNVTHFDAGSAAACSPGWQPLQESGSLEQMPSWPQQPSAQHLPAPHVPPSGTFSLQMGHSMLVLAQRLWSFWQPAPQYGSSFVPSVRPHTPSAEQQRPAEGWTAPGHVSAAGSYTTCTAL